MLVTSAHSFKLQPYFVGDNIDVARAYASSLDVWTALKAPWHSF